MARLILKPTSWSTMTSYEVVQEGSVKYSVGASCGWGLGLELKDRESSGDVVMSAEQGALSNIEITGPAGELVTVAQASSQRFADISFNYGGRNYRWVPSMKRTKSKFNFTLVDASSGRQIATLKQVSSWSRSSELTLYAGVYDPVWRSLVVLGAALAFKQWQESMFLTLTHS